MAKPELYQMVVEWEDPTGQPGMKVIPFAPGHEVAQRVVEYMRQRKFKITNIQITETN